ncbi:MAG: methionyl-tRNA formyltransferase [Chitinophagaceae bacterium]|nr:methionyl-tRNA formyltransferase [Chitinophagaceae bacterium]
MIRLHLLGYKGFVALSKLDKKYLAKITDVVIAKDKNIKTDYYEELAAYCNANNIKHYERTKEPATTASVNIAIGWRWLIQGESTLIVFHDSLLPQYRGFNPLVTALINGDTEIGVTALYGTKEYDRGDIIGQKKIGIIYPIKVDEAISTVSELYAGLLNEFFDNYFSSSVTATAQDESKATYSLWRDNDDYHINWNLPAAEIVRFIDAVGYPYDGAKTILENNMVTINDAKELPDITIANRVPGKVIFKEGNTFTIVCGKGLIAVSEFKDTAGNTIDLSNKFRLRFQ